MGEDDIEQRADGQRTENAEGHIFRRILRLLGGGRNSVKTDEGEEDNAGATEDAAPPVTENTFVAHNPFRDQVRGVVGGIDEAPGQADEKQDNADFDVDDDGIYFG